MSYQPERIQCRLEECAAGTLLFYKESTDSTNNEAKKAEKEGAPSGSLFLTENQVQGKGRLGRTWISRPEDCLTFSLLVRPTLPPEKFTLLPLITGLAVAEAIEEVSGLTARIKWPNDVVLGTKKVCGILVEATGDPLAAVIGCGINTGKGSPSPELADKAVFLSEEAGREISREEVLFAVLKRLRAHYALLEQERSFAPFKALYEEKLINCGKEVEVISPEGSFRAFALGTDDAGNLLVRKSDGTVQPVASGEVSVRGIYGYV